MLRRILYLCRRVAQSDLKLAPAVYASHAGILIPAAQRGYEGVACLDDSARALELFCNLWVRTGAPAARRLATSLLEFVLSMEIMDGHFANFILTWDGRPNLTGPTSRPGGAFWQARVLRSLASVSRVLDDPRIEPAFWRTFAVSRRRQHRSLKVLTIEIQALLTAISVARSLVLESVLREWTAEITHRCASLAQPSYGGTHFDEVMSRALWGRQWEGVAAELAASDSDRGLLRLACNSADRILIPLAYDGFRLSHVQPYGVASVIYSLDQLAIHTGKGRYAHAAHLARAWFHGRNSAGTAIYDRQLGLVADGIDDRVVNWNSGSESNIVAAHALLGESTACREGGEQWLSN